MTKSIRITIITKDGYPIHAERGTWKAAVEFVVRQAETDERVNGASPAFMIDGNDPHCALERYTVRELLDEQTS